MLLCCPWHEPNFIFAHKVTFPPSGPQSQGSWSWWPETLGTSHLQSPEHRSPCHPRQLLSIIMWYLGICKNRSCCRILLSVPSNMLTMHLIGHHQEHHTHACVSTHMHTQTHASSAGSPGHCGHHSRGLPGNHDSSGIMKSPSHLSGSACHKTALAPHENPPPTLSLLMPPRGLLPR